MPHADKVFDTADDWMSLFGYRPVKPTMDDRRFIVGPLRLGGTFSDSTADDEINLLDATSMLNDPEIVEAWGLNSSSANIEAIMHVQAVRLRFTGNDWRILDPILKGNFLQNIQLQYKVNGQNHFLPLDVGTVESFQRSLQAVATDAAEVRGGWIKLRRSFQVLTDVDEMKLIVPDSIAHGGLFGYVDVAGFLFPDDAPRDPRFAARTSGVCNSGGDIETVVQAAVLTEAIGGAQISPGALLGIQG